MRFNLLLSLAVACTQSVAAKGGKGGGLVGLLPKAATLITKGIGAATKTSKGQGGTPTSTANTTQTTCAPSDTACISCAYAVATIDACSTAIPDFDDASDETLADCLCYNPAPGNSSSLVWVPNQFDVPFSGCPVWASTADPTAGSNLTQVTGFCNSVKNVLNVSSTDMASLNVATITNSAQMSSVLASGTAVKGSQTAGATGSSGSSSSDGATIVSLATTMSLGLVAALTLAFALAL